MLTSPLTSSLTSALPDTGPVTVVWGETAAGDERRATHAALVGAAAAITGGPVGRIRLEYEPGGRPRLTGPAAGLHVSLSHSTGAGAVALSRHHPVGVDVETVRPLPAVPMARRWLDETAADWVARSPRHARIHAFLWLWTQKEAIGKARGHGLRDGGLTQRIPPPPEAPPLRPAGRLRPLPDDPGTASAVLPAGSARHVLAVAVSGG
ncbi:4'-phosphopantetheinyl transferase superfamily protein [Streptomyces sp. NPDC050636]|uniref:4'-phosphopantetheinyl transferase family protein n=1 Tax=Streptomyces sp. NPDC050636 TaxID=3154510 RepID=UPI00342CB806